MSKYMKVYQIICLKAYISKRNKSNGYFEKHHIQPKSLNGLNIDSNLCLLTAKEHYIVHFLLYKHFKSIGDLSSMNKMAYAWNMMCMNSSGKRYTSSTFELAKLAMIKAKIGVPLSQEHKRNISKSLIGHTGYFFGTNSGSFEKGNIPWNTGMKMSEEHCKKISYAHKGKLHSKEHKNNISKALKGIKHKIVECPHCGKTGGKPAMKQWHFNNCKLYK